MEQKVVQTALGEVWLRGRFRHFRPDAPLVLTICGAFAPPDTFHKLPTSLAVADVVLAHLPGMNTPHLSRISVGAFGEAFDEAMSNAFPGRRFLKFGASVGGLAALAMRTGGRILAMDPPLSTAALWPMIPRLQAMLRATADPDLAEWIWSIFGVSRDAVVNRDYRPLLAATRQPGVVFIAGEPLEPQRAIARLPGLMTAEDRRLVAAHPALRAVTAPDAGHNIPEYAPAQLFELLLAETALLDDGSGR